jgi:hypothetical protein
MKNRFRYKQILLALLTILSVTACQEEIVNYNEGYDDGLTPNGAPKIDMIAYAKDTAAQLTAIDGAAMSDMIVIYGENLSQIQSIRFNDVDADLKTVYAVNSRITMPVPRQFPTIEDNKLTITTSQGNITRDFVVTIPPLILNGLYNEFADAGDTVKIMGANFDLYDITIEKAEVKISGQTLDIIEAANDYVSVQIPEGTPDGAIITVTSPTVVEQGYEKPLEVSFREWGMSLEQETYGSWGDKYPADGTKAGEPKPLTGKDWYTRVVGSFENSYWGWIFAGGANMTDQDFVDHWENYDIKYEVLTQKPFSIGNFEFEYNGGERKTWQPGAGGIPLNTYGAWKTVTFDASRFVNKQAALGSWANFAIAFQAASSETITVDISFSNFRVVKKLNQ